MEPFYSRDEKELHKEYFKLKPSASTEADEHVWREQCGIAVKRMHTALENSAYCESSSAVAGRIELIEGLVQALEKCTGLENHRFEWVDGESAFHENMRTGMIKNLRHVDPNDFLQDAAPLVIAKIKDVLNELLCVKVSSILTAEFVRAEKSDTFYSATHTVQLLVSSNFDEWFNNATTQILTNLEEFQERDSGWALSRVIDLTINITKCNPIRGSRFIDLPSELKKKKAIVNVETFDDACFAWAVVSALYPASYHANRVSSYPHYRNVLNLTGIEFPMTLKQVKKFEDLNNVSINVYSHDKNFVYSMYLTDNVIEGRHIHLFLLYDGGTNNHFCWIKNFSRLVSQQMRTHNRRVHICDRCVHGFNTENALKMHSRDCKKQNQCAVILPTEEEKMLSFKNAKNKIKVPFVVYADLECILKDCLENDAPASAYQSHEVHSAAYYLHCSYDNTLSRFNCRRGPDAAKWLSLELLNITYEMNE